MFSVNTTTGVGESKQFYISLHELDDSGETFMRDLYIVCFAKLFLLTIRIAMIQHLFHLFGNIEFGVIQIEQMTQAETRIWVW